MEAPLSKKGTSATKLRLEKDELRSFLKQNEAFNYWRSIGTIPKANGARPGSTLAGQIMLNALVDDLYQESVPPAAIARYEKLWAKIVDKICHNAWSKPTPIDPKGSSAVETLVERVAEKGSVSREQVIDLLRAAPFPVGDLEAEVLLPSREQIEAARSLEQIRTTVANLEARLTQISDGTPSLSDVDEVRRELHNVQSTLSQDASARENLGEDVAAAIGDLSAQVQSIATGHAELRTQIATAITELSDQKVIYDALKTQVVTLATARSEEPQKPTQSTAAGDTIVLIKPSVKVVEARDELEVRSGLEEQRKSIIAVLRSAGVAKQSADDAAAIIASSFLASGWLNITGSLASYLSGKLAAAARARIARVTVPVGCLESIPEPPRDWAGTPTLWQINGFDRAPAQITSRHLRERAVKKLLSRHGWNFVIAVHEGGGFCHNTLIEATQLGPWIDTDSLNWTLRKADAVATEVVNFSELCKNEARVDADAEDPRATTALARITEARYSSVLASFISEGSTRATLLERSFLAPLYAADHNAVIDQIVRDDEARQIAIRLRER